MGADHHGYIPRLQAAFMSLGYEREDLSVDIIQMARMIKDGVEFKMSKRTGKAVALKDLIDEAGVDAVRYYFVSKAGDTHMDLDLDMATSQSNDNPVYYAEINWNELMKATKKTEVTFKELSKFPAVRRDLALLIDKSVQFADIEKIAYESERKFLKSVELFDVYEGKNLEAGKKSYAVCFILQDENATLNDKQIDNIMSKLITNLQKKLDAKLR